MHTIQLKSFSGLYTILNPKNKLRYIEENIFKFLKIQFNLESYLVSGKSLEVWDSDKEQWVNDKKAIVELANKTQKRLSTKTPFQISVNDILKAFVRIEKEGKFFTKKSGLENILNFNVVKINNPCKSNKTRRHKVVLNIGEICYVSFGERKRFFKKYAKAYPCYVESTYSAGGVEYYDILLFKPSKGDYKKSFRSRFLMKSNEVGRTPDEAIVNYAASHSIY